MRFEDIIMNDHYPKNQPDIMKRVMQTIDRFSMLEPLDRVLIGVSGGPDSTALLHILNRLAPYYKIDLAVAHLHHGLRPDDADRDAVFVKQMARDLDLIFHLEYATIDTRKGSIEEQARHMRYAFFKALADKFGYNKIALGHQKNDNAEAVLMHLLRGSGIRGLSGIPPVREPGVIRPLIQLDRSMITSYLVESDTPFVVDSTNDDPAFERNRIRHHLIPLLKESYNTNIVDTLHRTADLCREEEIWIEQQLKPLLEKSVATSTDGQLILHLHELTFQPLALQRRLLRGALRQWRGNLRRMQVSHIDSLVDLIASKGEGKKISLPYGIEAERCRNQLCLTDTTRSPVVSEPVHKDPMFYPYSITNVGELPTSIDILTARCRLTFDLYSSVQPDELTHPDHRQAWFDLDKIDFPLLIRSFNPGDRIHPLGMQGTQKIKKLFIDNKIPKSRRLEVPLLESKGVILWVAGLRRSSRAMVSKTTNKILKVTIGKIPTKAVR